MEGGYARITDIGADHHDLSLRKIDHLCGLVNEHESQGDQRVNTSQSCSVNYSVYNRLCVPIYDDK